MNDLTPGNRDIAMVFQFYALYPHLTAFDNISFPLRAMNTPRRKLKRACAKWRDFENRVFVGAQAQANGRRRTAARGAGAGDCAASLCRF